MPPDQLPQQPVPPPYPSQPPAAPQSDYDFIMSPQKPNRLPLFSRLPGTGSRAMKAIYISGGLLVLLILFTILKGLFGNSGSYLTYFVTTAQDQQEIIHLTANANDQRGLPVGTQNFAATAGASLTSSQTATIQYLAKNGRKVNNKVINLKIDTSVDQQLSNAMSGGIYDQTFKGIMNHKLSAYMNDLRTAYKQTKGLKGRALLNDEYKQANLLQAQLNAPSQ